ncbi:MAG: hypothetical protein ACI9KI_001898, partial [Patiriisocius sp.]
TKRVKISRKDSDSVGVYQSEIPFLLRKYKRFKISVFPKKSV